MNLFDIFENGDFSAALKNGNLGSALNGILNQAKTMAGNVQEATPGGMGGLMGAGALGTLLGSVLGGNAVKGAALAGIGAVAWNFYKKWAAQEQDSGEPLSVQASSTSSNSSTSVDPTSQLIIRAMSYAARSDGNIDAQERQRMDDIVQRILPGNNLGMVIEKINQETIDPSRLAREVVSPEQAEDVYRLSASVIDIDQFMERNYMDALASALHISPAAQKQLEEESNQLKKQLKAALSA